MDTIRNPRVCFNYISIICRFDIDTNTVNLVRLFKIFTVKQCAGLQNSLKRLHDYLGHVHQSPHLSTWANPRLIL